MRLRQCVFVCGDLESSREELCDILGIEVAYRDPGVAKWGLVNVVCPTGHDFLEIVTPFQQGTSAGRYIERRKGDGGYMVIIQVPDAAAERKRVTDLGVRAVAQKDLPEYQYTHFHPSDTAGVLLSLDTTFAPKGVDPALWWPPAEKGWLKHAHSNVTNGLAGVEIQHPDPAAAAASWSKILGRPLDASDGGNRLKLDGSEIRFVADRDGRGQGVSAYDVKAVNRDKILSAAEKRGRKLGPSQVQVCGCRINLV
jgi:catechol 2,3-dioxygenase-like lactoylglutathione lyase family enzyme